MKYLSSLFFAFIAGFYLVLVQLRAPTELRAFALQVLPFFLIYQLWIHYAALMNVVRVFKLGLLSDFNLRMGKVARVIGSVLDFAFNLLSILFLWELPHEWLFSGRVTRLIAEDEDWRGERALWWRVNVLDYLDSAGVHRG